MESGPLPDIKERIAGEEVNPDNDSKIEIVQYEHHGRIVSVFEYCKGLHKDVCLCYSCSKFHPGEPDNCPIAQVTYENCVRFGILTPMWECPEFTE